MVKSEWGGREHVLSPFALFLSNKCRVGCETYIALYWSGRN